MGGKAVFAGSLAGEAIRRALLAEKQTGQSAPEPVIYGGRAGGGMSAGVVLAAATALMAAPIDGGTEPEPHRGPIPIERGARLFDRVWINPKGSQQATPDDRRKRLRKLQRQARRRQR